jgi:hypothetical protein
MTDPGYVIAGWVIAGGVLGGYTLVLARRVRRAEAEQSEPEPRP